MISMRSSPTTNNKQIRLAQHYLQQLRKANRLYQQGGEHVSRSLNMLQQQWGQIKQFHSWAFEQRFGDQRAAVFCSAYPQVAGKLLDLILTLQEHRAWREVGLAMARLINDQTAEMSHLLALAHVHEKLDAYPIAGEYTQQALTLAQQMQNDDMIAQAALMMGILEKDFGNYRDAIIYLEQGLGIFRIHIQEDGIAKSLIELGEIANLRGLFRVAHDYFVDALDIYRRIDDRRGIATSLGCLATTLYDQGDYEIAERYHHDALRLSRQIGDHLAAADVMAELGRRTLGQSELDEASHYCEESVSIYRSMGNLRGTAQSLIRLATIASVNGELKTALVAGEEGVQIYQQIGNRYGIASGLIVLAYIKQRSGIIADSQDHMIRALNITLDIGASMLIPQLIAVAANHLLITGQAERGAMFLGLANNSPWLQAYIRDFAFPSVLEWFLQALDASILAVAFERGKNLDLDETLANILSEWG
jgi:tetratricopeptide (TPR) repeat protein